MRNTKWLLAVALLALCAAPVSAAEQPLNDEAWAVLDQGLGSEKADTRSQAATALALMPGNRKAIESAEQAIADADATVSRAAITALGDMQAKASVPKIKARIDQSDAKTVLVIAAALLELKDPEAYEIYYELLTGKRKGGGSIRSSIKDRKTLEKMGVEAAIGFAPFGGIATGAYDYFRKNRAATDSVWVTAATALGTDADPVTQQALVEAAFNDKEPVRIAALAALAKRGNPAVLNDIKPAMYADRPVVRYTAAATIVHLFDVQAKRKGPATKRRAKK